MCTLVGQISVSNFFLQLKPFQDGSRLKMLMSNFMKTVLDNTNVVGR
jgi:hypothetical protein